MDFSAVLPTLHSQHALAEFDANDNDLRRSEEVADVFDRCRQPSVKVATFIARIEEQSVKRRHQAYDSTKDSTHNWSVCELPCDIESFLSPGWEAFVPISRLEEIYCG